ncbi:hypothetical protein JCM10449v2_002652 [Rhodotorula kratochvilovae]
MLGVFPASGGLGGSIAAHLLALVPPSELVFIARHPAKLADAQAKGVTVRQADYDAPETLERAFEGVKTLCLISYASIQDDHRFESHKLAIDAARATGTTHVLYTSLAFAGAPESTSSVAQVMQAHLRTEAYLRELAARESGFSYTIIREGLYTESTPIYTAFFTLSAPFSPIRIPHDGSGPGIAWAKRDELGEATARVLLSLHRGDDAHRNELRLLTGTRALSLEETVALLGRAAGRPDLRIERVSEEEYAAQPQVQAGFGGYPGGGGKWALPWATAWEGVRRGETAVVTPTLGELLGREPEAFAVTLEALAKEAKRGE